MCGRYALNASLDEIYKCFRVKPSQKIPPQEPLSPYNIGPQMDVPIIIDGKLGQALWRYIPSWFKEDNMGVKLKNARSETIAEKPSFRDNWLKGKVCAIPMTGFYEWQSSGRDKQPFFVTTALDATQVYEKKPLFFAAGLYDVWRGELGFTILTKPAREELSFIHHREPVVFSAPFYDMWLQSSPQQRKEMMGTNVTEDIHYWAVSKDVGNIKKNDPALIALDQKQGKRALL